MTKDSTAAPTAFQRLIGQPRVREFLASAVAHNRVSHAYLFLGASGSGQTEAALALAQCLVCRDGGCDCCDECIRIAHRTHPDIHWISPEGASGYVIEQVRSLISDVALAPVRGSAKIYILDRVETLRDACANALLKTIEEPPSDVIFILMARTQESVLPTIASRCQCVPFRVVNSTDAVRRVAYTCGLDETDPNIQIALDIVVTPEFASEFLRSPERREARRQMVYTLDNLAHNDMWDVLVAARELVGAAKAPLDIVRLTQEEVLEQSEDYLSAKAMKLIEQRNKRELTAHERSGMMEIIAAAESVLRDVLLRHESYSTHLVNSDSVDVIERLVSHSTTAGVIGALEACARAKDDIAHNVSPQLALEVMLCACKELLCPVSSR